METVTSRDGTEIAIARSGRGPPLVLVHGSTADHSRWDGVRAGLARHFTVHAMDRRGRGASGDGPTYVLDLEFDDVAAVVRAAGPGCHLLGHSFGALCALEAARRIEDLQRLVLYEPAFAVGGKPLYPPGLPDRLRALLDRGDREAFLVAFFREVAGVPAAQVEALRADPSWPARLASAHTALREMADGTYDFDPRRFSGLKLPVLLMIGETSPAELTAPSRALDAVLPDSRVTILKGQGHIAMTTAPGIFLATVLDFLTI